MAPVQALKQEAPGFDLSDWVPEELRALPDPQTAIPAIAKTPRLMSLIDNAVRAVPTRHRLVHRDARLLGELPPGSVQLVLTSPPYWTLKEYRHSAGQLGDVADYEAFLGELDRVWQHCFRALVSGGRLICVVGDVCLSRRKNEGRHTVVPLHASIQEHCRRIGLDNLAPIIWHKMANAAYEVGNGAPGFLGEPYEPNAVIKNDIEFILMQRKPGGYRKPSLAERLIRMFSFVGDTVLDPFLGTGTTSAAAARCGRHSLGFEVDEHDVRLAERRVRGEATGLSPRRPSKSPDGGGQHDSHERAGTDPGASVRGSPLLADPRASGRGPGRDDRRTRRPGCRDRRRAPRRLRRLGGAAAS